MDPTQRLPYKGPYRKNTHLKGHHRPLDLYLDISWLLITIYGRSAGRRYNISIC